MFLDIQSTAALIRFPLHNKVPNISITQLS